MIVSELEMLAWLDTGHDPEVVQTAHQAAEAWVLARCRWWRFPLTTEEPPPAPEDIRQAVRLLTARFISRRNSPDGLTGLGDLGFARLPSVDADVTSLINPWRPVVVA